MSTLENLTAKISKDSDNQVAAILDSARQEARHISETMEAEAEADREKIIAEAHIEAAREEQQIVVGKTLAVRDQNLDAKQQMLDKVFEEALQRLNNMSQAEYLAFLTSYLGSLDLDGEEIIVPAKYGITDLDSLNAALKEAGKKGNLTLSKDSRKIDGGFVLCKDGIEQNNTFEALVAYYRYELEGEVIGALY